MMLLRTIRSPRTILLLLVLVLAVQVVSTIRILLLPFPFVKMEWVREQGDFETAPENSSSFEESLQRIEAWSKRVRLEVGVVTEPASDALVRSQSDFLRPGQLFPVCSEHALYFAWLAQEEGLPARTIWMDGHTVAEVLTEEFGWVMVDPHGNQMFQKADEFLGVVEILQAYQAGDPPALIPVCSGPEKGKAENFGPEKAEEIYRGQSIVVAMELSDVLGMRELNASRIALLRSYLIGSDVEGIQFLSNDSPKLGNCRIGSFLLR